MAQTTWKKFSALRRQIVFVASLIYVPAIVFILPQSCATSNVVFSTDKKATISLVSHQDPGADGQILGESPQTIETSALNDRFVKVWGEGLIPQYWVFTEAIGSEMKLALRMQERKLDQANKDGKNKGDDKPESEDDKGEPLAKESLRLLLQAYQSLALQNFNDATELSKKFNELQPTMASGHIIEGISYLQQGNKDAARSAFKVAQSLDPEDANTLALIEACN